MSDIIKMNHNEFAFFNQQLAAMLREGIPLEGALRQLSSEMRTGPLRDDVQQLEAELARGTPLKDALARRTLPEFYKQMIEIGARGNDLPGVLIMVADHYHRTYAIWTRLKGLMVYPALVIIVALGLTILLSLMLDRFLATFFDYGLGQPPQRLLMLASIWVTPAILTLAALVGVAIAAMPRLRTRLRWRIPGFREASLAQTASVIALLLKNGSTLAEALAFAEGLEANTSAGKSLAQWRQLIANGAGKPSMWPPPTKPIPPLFLWLVRSGGENLAAGFAKAAEIYHARASYRIEMALYGALPVSILILGQMVFWQIAPLLQSMAWLMNNLGGN
ncbi:MAG: hypothetical protein HOP33_07715 [Verrucomicrobia bacterium]|nr:hypothetical protein [Verrucomicrobiota bacterium]